MYQRASMKPFSALGQMFATGALLALGGCASYSNIPNQIPEAQKPPAPVTTGSRIPRGTNQEVRDTTQNVDVYTEQELEEDRPVSTRDAVRRAIRGR